MCAPLLTVLAVLSEIVTPLAKRVDIVVSEAPVDAMDIA